MTEHYVSFTDDIWTKFPTFAEKELTDITNHNLLWSLEEYQKANYVNFKTGKEELYRLSILIENYAVKHKTPLLATFETKKRYNADEIRIVEYKTCVLKFFATKYEISNDIINKIIFVNFASNSSNLGPKISGPFLKTSSTAPRISSLNNSYSFE